MNFVIQNRKNLTVLFNFSNSYRFQYEIFRLKLPCNDDVNFQAQNYKIAVIHLSEMSKNSVNLKQIESGKTCSSCKTNLNFFNLRNM